MHIMYKFNLNHQLKRDKIILEMSELKQNDSRNIFNAHCVFMFLLISLA